MRRDGAIHCELDLPTSTINQKCPSKMPLCPSDGCNSSVVLFSSQVTGACVELEKKEIKEKEKRIKQNTGS